LSRKPQSFYGEAGPQAYNQTAQNKIGKALIGHGAVGMRMNLAAEGPAEADAPQRDLPSLIKSLSAP
jgi:hypothetical protein